MDRVSKVIEGNIGAFDSMTMIKSKIMEVIVFKIKANWARYLFKKMREFFLKIEANKGSFVEKPTFGILTSYLLSSKGFELKNKKQLQKS